jgi:hypothetical protein
MRLAIEATLSYYMPHSADVLLAIEAAPMDEQRLIDDRLTVSGVGPLHTVPGDDGIGRRTWTCGHGEFLAQYRGTFDVEREAESLLHLPAAARRDLPAHVIPYLWPSRFCESDRFVSFEKTSAVDTFVAREGVCRDFSHVMAAFARAGGIPARLVSAYAWQLEPQDFHAVVDVWVGDRWRLVDASGLAPIEGLVRIAVGRDATDVSFMTIFGTADFRDQQVRVTRIDEPDRASAQGAD